MAYTQTAGNVQLNWHKAVGSGDGQSVAAMHDGCSRLHLLMRVFFCGMHIAWCMFILSIQIHTLSNTKANTCTMLDCILLDVS